MNEEHGSKNAPEGGLEILDQLKRDALGEIGNIAMGAAATAFSQLIQQRVEITTPEVHVVRAQEVPNRAGHPHVRVEIDYVEGLQGTNYLLVGARDAAVIADLMMGGDGGVSGEELSSLQISAVTEAMNQMMGASATAMSSFFGIRVDISPAAAEWIADESQDGPGDEIVVFIKFSIRISDLIDSDLVQVMSIEFAQDLVERVFAVSQAQVASFAEESAASALPAVSEAEEPAYAEPGGGLTGRLLGGAALGAFSVDLIGGIPVEVAARLGESQLSMEEVLRLSPGSVVPLNRQHGDAIEIHARGVPIAKGEVVVVKDHFAVRVTEVTGAGGRGSGARND